MEEKRKHNRVVMNTTITARSLYNASGNAEKDCFEIDIFDISLGGIGFHSTRLLPLNSFYDAHIKLLNGEYFDCIIKIVRGSGNRTYTYGAEYINLNPTDAYRLEMYSMILANEINK